MPPSHRELFLLTTDRKRNLLVACPSVPYMCRGSLCRSEDRGGGVPSTARSGSTKLERSRDDGIAILNLHSCPKLAAEVARMDRRQNPVITSKPRTSSSLRLRLGKRSRASCLNGRGMDAKKLTASLPFGVSRVAGRGQKAMWRGMSRCPCNSSWLLARVSNMSTPAKPSAEILASITLSSPEKGYP